MKAKLAFLAIAFIAITSAFTTRPTNILAHKYLVAAVDNLNGRYQLVTSTDITPLLEGTESGQYECNNSSEICWVATNNSAYQSAGVWHLSFSESEHIEEGTFVFHQ
jgi:hypothetical protein